MQWTPVASSRGIRMLKIWASLIVGVLTRLNLPVSRLRIVAWLIYWSANKRNGPRIAFATMRASRIHQIGAGRSKFGRDGGIRTHDPLTPSQVRYQAALHPEPVDRIRRHGAGNVAVLPAATCSLRIYKEWSRSITKGIRSFGHRSIRALVLIATLRAPARCAWGQCQGTSRESRNSFPAHWQH